MSDLRVPEEMVLRTARLVNEIEDVRQQANADLKQIWADAREELRALNLGGKEISTEVAALKAAISEDRLSQAELATREEKAEGRDGYLAIIQSPRARARTRGAAGQREEISPKAPDDGRLGPAGREMEITSEITEPQLPEAAAQAVPSVAPEALSSPVESEAAAISTLNQPETANEIELTCAPDHGQETAPKETASDEGESNYSPAARRHSTTDSRAGALAFDKGTTQREDGASPASALPTYLSPDAPFHDPNDIEDEDGAQPVEASVPPAVARVWSLRPNCQNPTACGSSGGAAHCWRCTKAMAEAEAVA